MGMDSGGNRFLQTQRHLPAQVRHHGVPGGERFICLNTFVGIDVGNDGAYDTTVVGSHDEQNRLVLAEVDSDGDGVGDVCDSDADNDGILDVDEGYGIGLGQTIDQREFVIIYLQ